MGRFLFACLLLAQILLVRSAAQISDTSELYPQQRRVRSLDESHGDASTSIADPPVSTAHAESSAEDEKEPTAAEAPEIRRMGKHHSDKSVAGGGVILGGLVTAIFAAVYCYIRVTRRRDGDKH